MMESEPVFNDLIHAPIRLEICALLTPLEEAEFQVLRDELGVSDSVLSKHISRLKEAGYVQVRKSVMAGRRRTWAGLTVEGRRSFNEHVAALQNILAGVNGWVTQ